jgi:hypothetical protein
MNTGISQGERRRTQKFPLGRKELKREYSSEEELNT